MTDGLAAFSLAGRTALITGAGQGIGRSLALGLAGAGARVAVTDVNADTTARVADEVRALKVDVAHRVLDVARTDDIEPAVVWAEGDLGPIDILVNNAGVREPTFDSFALTAADWDHILAVNLRGPFLLCQAVGRRLAERGGGGSSINIASQLGVVGMAGRPAYTASKAGLINLTRTLALEWAPKRIRVNAIAPGPIRTPFTERIASDRAA